MPGCYAWLAALRFLEAVFMKKTSKRLLSLLLCVALALSLFPAALAAAQERREYSQYPCVVVPGYSSAGLYRYGENGEKIWVWGVQTEEIVETVLKHIVELGAGIGALTVGNAKLLGETVGREFYNLYYDLACNEDGSSVYDLHRYQVTAEESNSAVLQAQYPDGYYQHEVEIMTDIAQYIGGKENVYNFNCDFRMGAPFCAKQLDEFIQSVKEYSGQDKVNIFSVSHGGQVTGTYLTLYGDKGDVNNALMTVPALGGAALAYDVYSDQIHLDEYDLMRFIEHGMMWETDYEWLLKAQRLGFLDQVLHYARPYVLKVLGYWGSIWDFIPTPYYEEMKAQYLDPEKSAPLIEKSDYMHYEVMPQFGEGFRRAQAAGTQVFIIAGYENPSVSGLQESSDGIITIAASTGATPAPFGMRYNDGYVQKVDTGCYQISPSMTLDASTAYLPRHTFFVENLYHGMVYKDKFTEELVRTLLLTREITDVHSNPDYPQFHATTNKSHSVFAAFNNSVEGYADQSDTTLVVRNLSEQYPMKILGVEARGVDLTFNALKTKWLKPGESLELTFTGTLPQVSGKGFDLVIDYTQPGSATPRGERTLHFTLQNGPRVAYDESTPFVSRNAAGGLDTALCEPASQLLNKSANKDIYVMWYQFLQSLRVYFAALAAKLR